VSRDGTGWLVLERGQSGQSRQSGHKTTKKRLGGVTERKRVKVQDGKDNSGARQLEGRLRIIQ
jgi:hypothetical protein